MHNEKPLNVNHEEYFDLKKDRSKVQYHIITKKYKKKIESAKKRMAELKKSA